MSQTPSGTKRSSDGGSSSGGKKSRGENTTLRFLLQSKHAGGIIGKGGQTIKRLRSEYSATVSVPDSSTNERVLSITASQDNAVSVLKECLPLFHDPPYPNGSGNQDKQNQHEINFLVHSSLIGAIIGRSGAKIKELQEQTMANIKIISNCLPSSTERVVIIGGTEDNIISALCKMFDMIQEQPIKGTIALYDPNQDGWNEPGFNDYGSQSGGGMRGMRGGGRGSMKGRSSNFGFGNSYGSRNDNNYSSNFGSNDYGSNQNFASYGGDFQSDANISSSGENETSKVTIPNDVAGAIIGKGGERIRNIRQRSGADIKIEDPQPGKQDRVITICGFPDQIQYAQFLMQQSIRQHSHKK